MLHIYKCYLFAYTKDTELLHYSVQRENLYKVLAWNHASFLLQKLIIFISKL